MDIALWIALSAKESAVQWGAYFLGQLLHFFFKADAAVVSPSSSVHNYGDYFKRNYRPLLIRFFLETILFILFNEFGPMIFGDFGFPAAAQASLLAKAAIAALFGYSGDSILDKAQARFTFLQGQVPDKP